MLSEEIDLHELIDECIESSMPLARGKQLKIEKNVPLELPPLSADRTKVKQILLNLLSNAIKFTAQGRVLVSVVAEPDAARVSVADTGIGIREDDLARLFEPFQQLDNPIARNAGAPDSAGDQQEVRRAPRGRIWARAVRTKGQRSISRCLDLRRSRVPARPPDQKVKILYIETTARTGCSSARSRGGRVRDRRGRDGLAGIERRSARSRRSSCSTSISRESTV